MSDPMSTYGDIASCAVRAHGQLCVWGVQHVYFRAAVSVSVCTEGAGTGAGDVCARV